MIDHNHVSLIGRLTRDPEVKYTTSGTPVCTFSLALNRDYGGNKEVYYIDIEAWRKTAELCGEYLKKGKQVAINGYLKQSRWETQQGKRSKVLVVASEVQFLGQRETKVTYEEPEENPPAAG